MYREDMPELDQTDERRTDWSHNIPFASKVIRNMKASGLKDQEVCRLLGMSTSNLSRVRKAYPPIEEAYVEGKAECVQAVIGQLFKKAIGGEICQEIVTEDIVYKGEVTGKRKKVIKKETQPDFRSMELILTNLDAANWTKARKADTNRKIGYVNGKTEADKIHRLAEGILGDNTEVAEGEFVVPPETSHSSGSGQSDAEDVSSGVSCEAADNVQDDVVDVSAEAGTERT